MSVPLGEKSTEIRQIFVLLLSPILLIGFASAFVSFVTESKETQLATAGATSQKEGSCGKAYRACLTSNSTECEERWKTCINAKCLRTESKYHFQACSSDDDCLSSCTQWATSKTGLVSCCFAGPQHGNACSHKVDTKCVNSEDFGYTIFPGMEGSKEGDVIPSGRPSKESLMQSDFFSPPPPTSLPQQQFDSLRQMPSAPMEVPIGPHYDPPNFDNSDTAPLQSASYDSELAYRGISDIAGSPAVGNQLTRTASLYDAVGVNQSVHTLSQIQTVGANNNFAPTYSNYQTTFGSPDSRISSIASWIPWGNIVFVAHI